MKKTIKDYNLTGKKVIIRCDFNVPMEEGRITDDNRIVQSLPTIKYAIENGAKIILMSHLGRVKTEEDLIKNNLKPVALKLSELLNKTIIFIDETRGEKLENACNNLKNGEVLLMQNTRYEDLEGKKESSNDEELAKYWSSLADIYINDAFGTCHRAHASNVGIASNLPNGIGFLVEKEINALENAISNPKRPYTVIMGGAKISDKITLIEHLVKEVDHILIGGAMAYTFLKAQGKNLGKSLIDTENVDFCKKMLDNNQGKIILPVDHIVSNNIENGNIKIIEDNFDKEDIGLDIGPKTIELFSTYLEKSKTIIWNGPVGYTEKNEFSNGTKALCEILKTLDSTVIIGGGDTAASIIKLGYSNEFTHISTGGGATLEYLEGKELPGIKIISEK